MPERCPWANAHPLLLSYHDTEWGAPLHDDRKLFEFLVLETFQAGLSWLTILKKREFLRESMDMFDPEKIARWDDRDIERFMSGEGVIRNKRKIEASIKNARAFLEIVESKGSFDSYLWGFVAGEPIVSGLERIEDMPAETDLSRKLSKDMKSRGFAFVGPVICYSHMQAVGMVNDHLTSCFRYSIS